MVDIFALALTHALMLVAAYKLTQREDLDADAPAEGAAVLPGERPRA